MLLPTYLALFVAVLVYAVWRRQGRLWKRRQLRLENMADARHSLPPPDMSCTGLQSVVDGLHAKLLPFYVHADDVMFLHSPPAFHAKLLDMIRTARRRIVLMSLYWSNAAESEVAVLDAVTERLEAQPGLELYVVMDKNRMIRSGKKLEAALRELSERFPGRVHYHTVAVPVVNTFARVLMRLRDVRFNELAGVQHIKMYIADDTTMWSGANLSDTYFTTRVDRYAVVQNVPLLASWCVDVLKCVVSECENNMSAEGLEGVRGKLVDLLTKGPAGLKEQQVTDTVLYPYLQMGSAKVQYDTAVLQYLLKGAHATPGTSVCMTSAYFNFTNAVLHTVLHGGDALIRILTSSLKCNSFVGGGTLGSCVPYGYKQLCRTFYVTVKNKAQASRVRLWEWKRSAHTFHAKGLWLERGGVVPLTTIGSSNLGSRSDLLDLELNIVLITRNKALQQRVAEERDMIFADAAEATDDTFRGKDGRFRPVIALISEVGRAMM
eukprot:PhM_4_TR6283/c0_g1_i1/m.93880/K00995/pgsA, PGS1; CDP-diacylglycerol--glycerol-3-phosphate 3-phosphatidyltransferase